MTMWDRIILLVAAAIIVIAIWSQSVNGRQDVINASRMTCYDNSLQNAVEVNNLRADIDELTAAARANHISGAGGVKGSTALKSARHTESTADYIAINRKRSLIIALDSAIDPRNVMALGTTADRVAVLHGQYVRRVAPGVYVPATSGGPNVGFLSTFSCSRLFRNATPFQFTR